MVTIELSNWLRNSNFFSREASSSDQLTVMSAFPELSDDGRSLFHDYWA